MRTGRPNDGATREQEGPMLELHENRKVQCWSYMRTGRPNAGATREQEGPMLELHENRKAQ